MRKEEKTTVIDFSNNPKNAALFFDYTVPVSPSLAGNNILGNVSMSILKSILPTEFQVPETYQMYVDLLIGYTSNVLLSMHLSQIHSFDSFTNYRFDNMVSEEAFEMFLKNSQEIISNYYNSDAGFTHLNESIIFIDILMSHAYNYILPSMQSLPDISSYNSVSIQLTQLPLIDTTNAPWEQIIEIREDKNSISKLRNLRLFFHKNYSGKDKNYVEDDLSKRLEDYKNTVDGWGFETMTSSMTLLSTSASTFGSALVLALTGQPLEVALASGLCVGIGNISLHIAKEKKKLSVLQRDHPLAYIIDAKEKLE